ncbi:MAG: hypothetical protein HC888_11060 [Candidatus Competibacteraceae bacterium]|nr:hypothetical protein [Candidatus Competibacteraceae bacterium]
MIFVPRDSTFFTMAPKKDDDDPNGCWDKDKKDDKDEHLGPLFRMPNKGQFRFSIWYFVAVFLGLLLINSFFVPAAETAIGFSDFKRKVESGEISTVQMGESAYVGTTSAPADGSRRQCIEPCRWTIPRSSVSWTNTRSNTSASPNAEAPSSTSS